MKRQTFQRRCVLWAVALNLISRQSFGASEPQTEVRLRIDDSIVGKIDRQSTRDALNIVRDESEEARNLIRGAPVTMGTPVLYLVVGALVTSQIWSLAIEMLRQFYYGGVIIDASKSPVDIRHSKAVPAGLVLVVLAGGQVRQFRAADFNQNVLEDILKIIPGRG